MNTYFKDKAEEYEIDGYCYFELDDDLYCLRAIYENQSKLHTTNFYSQEFQYALPDQSLEGIPHKMKKIPQIDFVTKWNQALRQHETDWKNLKKKITINQEIEVVGECFYPQGVILNINQKFNGLAKYCLNNIAKIQPRQKSILKVSCFDD